MSIRYPSRAISEHSDVVNRSANQSDVPIDHTQAPIDWNTNLVNFISSCGNPGLVRRASLAPLRGSGGTPVHSKGRHRRNLSAFTTIGFIRPPDTSQGFTVPSQTFFNFYPHSNNFNSFRKPSAVLPSAYFGHTRNISDPTSCWEYYRVDIKRPGLDSFLDHPVFPLINQSRQLSASDRAEEFSTSEELKSQTSPYIPSWQTAYPCWDVCGELAQPDGLEPVERQTSVPEEQCLCTCMQPCATPFTVLIGLCFIMFVQTLVAFGLISSMLTTLEQRFDFTGRQVGYFMSCFEGSGVLTTVAISFVNGRKHNRLRIIGLATLLLSCGFALFAVPHFIIGPYSPDVHLKEASDLSTLSAVAIRKRLPSGYSANISQTVQCSPYHPGYLKKSSFSPGDAADKTRPVYSLELLIFCIAMILAGVGGSPINVLGPTYLWDNLSDKQYPLYSALFYSAGGLGPACGFLAGAGFLSVYIDFPLIHPRSGFSRNDPRWLGNWWLGILVCAAVTFIAAMPVIAFPKRLSTERSVERSKLSDEELSAEASRSPKLPPCLKSSGISQTSLQHTTAGDLKVNGGYKLYNSCLLRSSFNQVGCVNDHRATSESTLPTARLAKKKSSHLRRTASCGGYPQKGNGTDDPPLQLVTFPDRACERLKAFIFVLRRVLANPVWLGVTFTSMVEHSVVAAFITFVSKYIQGLFQVPAYLASIHTGAVVVPSSLLGVLSGALLMRHCRPRVNHTLAGISVAIAGTVLTTVTLMLIGCPSNRIAGVTATYDGKPWPWAFGPAMLAKPNLTAPCNTGEHNEPGAPFSGSTRCSAAHFSPVCWRRSADTKDRDGSPKYMTFFNACFAGCQSENHNGLNQIEKNHLNCSCVAAGMLNSGGSSVYVNGELVTPGHVSPGRCPADCPQYPLFLVILFAHILLTGVLQNPSNVITLSCVAPEDSSVALGLQVFLMRTLAYIPAPIYFGQLFDLVCQYRISSFESNRVSFAECHSPPDSTPSSVLSSAYGPKTGACLQYNLEGLPIVWLGLVLSLKLISLFGAIITWRIACNRMQKSHPSVVNCSDSVTVPKRPPAARSLPSLRPQASELDSNVA